MRGEGTRSGEMPSLDAFDQEFGREPVAILRSQQRRTRLRPFIGLLLGAFIISVPILAWLNADGLRSSVQSGSMLLQSANRDGQDEQVDRLVREIAALKQEIKELTEAQQQAAERIASLQAAEQEARNGAAPAYWYSDLAALSFGNAAQPRSAVVAPAARRSATVRPGPREIRQRDSGEPLSLEAPQQ